MNERHTITLSGDAYLKLKSRGEFGESYSDLISRLIDELDLIGRSIEDRV